MKDNKMRIEQRMQNMKKFYVQAGELIDKLPDAVPTKTKEMLKDAILGDKELKELMEGIDSHRPPRIFMIGRTGVGKSSLINALCGSYVAKVSDITACTPTTSICDCKEGDRTLMQIFDTRGISESEKLDGNISAEEMLINQINEFSPDVAVYVIGCKQRDGILDDIEFLKKVAKAYSEINDVRLPIVVVVNKCDEMEPAREKDSTRYSQKKIEKIKEVVQDRKGIIIRHNLKIDGIIGVSSLIDWATPDGTEVAVEDIEYLPEHDKNNLQFAFDGRYQIEELLKLLEESIQDFEAQMGLRMASRLNEVVRRLAKHLTGIFETISATVALTPIPVSDIYILVTIQALLVCLIASLSGRELTLDAAKEFIVSLGGVFGAGQLFKILAQQLTKLLNGPFPGAGSAISGGIASLGTSAIGNAAISYYIDGHDIEDVKKVYKEKKEEAEKNK